MAEPVVRAFVAVPLPASVTATLGRVLTSFSHALGVRDIKWVDPEGCHITLKFLGDVPQSRIPAVEEALRKAVQRASPFALAFDTIGVFPAKESPRVIWVGCAVASAPLNELQQDVERELAAEAFPADRRRFSPHITLGRVRDHAERSSLRGLQAAMAEGQRLLEPSAVAHVDAAVLFRSTLTPHGAIYAPLAIVPFSSHSDH